MENLLEKIRTILKEDSKVIFISEARFGIDRFSIDKFMDYFCRYELAIAPKSGFYFLDEKIISEMKNFQDNIFKNLKTEEYKLEHISLEGYTNGLKQGIEFYYPKIHNEDLFVGRLHAWEGVGEVEQFQSNYQRIFPKFQEEFNKTKLCENESSIIRKHLARAITVYIYPSLEYAKLFQKINNRCIEMRKSNNFYVHSDNYTTLTKKLDQIGFKDSSTISIKDYSLFFCKCKK